MSQITLFVERRPLATFIVLAYLLSWLTVLPMQGMLLPYGPFIAALIVSACMAGKPGTKAFVTQVFRRGAGLRWYALALALPIGITFAAAGLNLLMGAAMPASIDWRTPFLALPLMVLFGGLWEEPGWTGFALPRLLDRFADRRLGFWIAALLMAGIRVGWHLPLMLYGQIYWTDIIVMVAAQLIFASIFTRSGRYVLPIMLLHLMNNTISGEFVTPWFTGADWVRYFWLLAALWAVAAGLILLGSELYGTRQRVDSEVGTGAAAKPVG